MSIKTGCEYCRGEIDIELSTDIGKTWINGNILENAYGEVMINFCPMCGCNISNNKVSQRTRLINVIRDNLL